MRTFFLILLLLPFVNNAQVEDDTLRMNTFLFSLPSSLNTMFVMQNAEALDDSLFLIQFSETAINDLTAIRAGILESHLSYSIIIDSTKIDSAVAHFQNLKPIGDFGLPNINSLDSEHRSHSIDSMMIDMSESFRSWSMELKNKGEYALSDLLNIGSWIESMYLLSCSAIQSKNEEIVQRILEQGTTVDRVLERLKEIKGSPSFIFIRRKMRKLQVIYSSIETKYNYKEPVSNNEAHLTTFGSTTEVKAPKDSMELINEILLQIRFIIINQADYQLIQH